VSHKDTLKALIPLDLGDTFAADVEQEGITLDSAQEIGGTLLDEMLPSKAYNLLAAWERVTGMAPAANEPIQSRRDRVARKLQQLGNIKKPYYEGLALALGYNIHIQEYLPTMPGWVGAGDELITDDDPAILFIWNAHIFNQSVYHFTAGQSMAGEYLSWWRPALELENLLDELCPAHVQFLFSYE